MYRQITVGNDPWSEAFKNIIRSLPRYQTVKIWQQDIDFPIPETPYYKARMEELSKYGCVWGYIRNEQDVLNATLNFKEMFEVAPNWKKYDRDIIYNPRENWYYGDFPCLINKNGEFELFDAFHRTSILLAQGQPIRLTICQEHPEWLELKKNLYNLYQGQNLYQPIPHPDFKDWQSSHSDYIEIELKKIFTQYSIKSVIDCGICHGHTLYQLKDYLIKGVGLEYESTRFQISDLLFQKLGFIAVHTNIVDYFKQDISRVDAILCLNVLHHVMKESTEDQFRQLLKKISDTCSIFIYSLPLPNEAQFRWMYSKYRNNINQFIQSCTKFTEQQIISTNNRTLVVLK